MYKKRIKDWKLNKNCKASEKEEILRRVEANRELGVDLGDPMLNGRTVKMRVIERHRKEKRKARSPSPDVSLALRDTLKRSSDIKKFTDRTTVALSDGRSSKRARPQGRTCSALISFSRIKDPAEYRDSQNLLFQVDQYYKSKLEKDPHAAWDAWAKSARARRTKISYNFQGRTLTCTFSSHAEVFNRFYSANDCLEENRHREAWKLIEEGAEMVRPLVQRESPSFLWALLRYYLYPFSATYAGVQKELLHHFSSMAIVLLGERHPISNVCRLLQILHGRKNVAELTLRKVRDILKHCLGEGHEALVVVQQKLCDELMQQERYDEAERSLHGLVDICERLHGRNAYYTRSTLLQLAELYYVMYRDPEAEGALEGVLQLCKECGKDDNAYVEAKRFQYHMCRNRGDYRAAEVHSWSALSGILRFLGPRDPTTTRLWIEYQSILVELQQSQEGSDPPLSCSEAHCDISEEPVRCLSRPRSSSLPPLDNCDRKNRDRKNRDRKIRFWHEAPT